MPAQPVEIRSKPQSRRMGDAPGSPWVCVFFSKRVNKSETRAVRPDFGADSLALFTRCAIEIRRGPPVMAGVGLMSIESPESARCWLQYLPAVLTAGETRH